MGFSDARKTLNAHSRQKLWLHDDVVALGQKTGSHRRLRQIVQVSSWPAQPLEGVGLGTRRKLLMIERNSIKGVSLRLNQVTIQ